MKNLNDKVVGKVRKDEYRRLIEERGKRRQGYVNKYDKLINQNKLLFTLDIIKEKLTGAYKMANEISEIMDICSSTGNNHFEGIIAHATYDISAGKIEGINNKIKTISRQGYCYPDDDYFFLKLFDASRKSYVKNPSSHKTPQSL